MTDGILLAEIDLDEIEKVRNEWTYLDDRRPDAYGALVS